MPNPYQTKNALIVLNIFSAMVAFYLGNSSEFPDWLTYWYMSEGLETGKFSSWFFLESYYPETIRTPGYPLFLLILRSISDSQLFIKVVQLLLYFATLLIAYKTLDKLSDSNILALCVFLFLTALNIQIPYYSGLISSESPSIFLTALFTYFITTKEKNLRNAIYLGLIGGLLFLMRPAFMLLPFCLLIYFIFIKRTAGKFILIHTLIFSFTLIPFSLWNLENHGVFKPTPIEGAASIAHMGYWNFKLPINYREDFQYNAAVIKDATNPISFSEEERVKYKEKYERDWLGLINSLQTHIKTDEVVAMKEMQLNNPGIFPIYNSKYTLLREQYLADLLVKEIKENPIYYLKTRIYTFFRVYYSGLNVKALKESPSLIVIFKSVYPFLITFFSIFIGLLIALIYYLKNRKKIDESFEILLMISLYYGAVSMPFAAQGRYTVPIHFCILIMLSIMSTKIPMLKRAEDETST